MPRTSVFRQSSLPEPLRGNAGAFGQRLEFSRHNAREYPFSAGICAEAAIGAGEYPLAPNDIGKFADALGNQNGMLDEIAGRIDDPGYQHLVVGNFCRLPILPLVLMGIHPAYLLWVLDGLAEGQVINQITVPEQIKEESQIALNRMLALR